MDIQSSFHMNDTNINDYVCSNNEYILDGIIEPETVIEEVLNANAAQYNANNNTELHLEEDKEEEDENEDEDNYDSTLVSHIVYNLEEEQKQEQADYDYHFNKDHGNWQYSKMIVSHSWQDKNATEFLTDYLERQFQSNNDCFENIQTVYYKNDLDIDIIYAFEADPAKHLVDNLRIPAFKPHGIIFNNPDDANKWTFKIVIITSRCIYTANRYITENVIGFY